MPGQQSNSAVDGPIAEVEPPHAPPAPPPAHLIRRAHQLFSALWTGQVGSTLTSPQYAVMATLYRMPAMDQVSITQAASLDRSTLADVLVRLESRNLVTRHRDTFDGRRNLVSLTEVGRALVDSVTPAVRAIEHELVGCFDEQELEAFVGHLRRLVTHGEERLAQRSAAGA